MYRRIDTQREARHTCDEQQKKVICKSDDYEQARR